MAALPAKRVSPKQVTGWMLVLRKWAYKKSGFGQLGLMIDDCLHETPAITEALRRLPEDLYDQRNFRISRALHLSMRKDILPKEEQHTVDDDVRYLKAYIEQVEQEMAEKDVWNKQ